MNARFAIEGRDVLFAHWPVPADALRDRLPDALDPDTFDGRAWVTALPHRVTGLSLAGRSVPLREFPQLNVRTYVTYDGEPGVFFLDCETGDGLGALVARRGFGVPFHHASMRFTADGDRFTFRSRRARPGGDVRFDARYRPEGAATEADPDSLAAFLVERTRWYTSGDRVGRIEREPWRLSPVDVSLRANTLGDALDLPLDGTPECHYSPGYEMAVFGPRRPEP